ncbi:MAG TPA: carbohydrate ABC transporter permease [Trueperaceae bacterium]|nr:carbohydrate ABC transporter permease [Trueperaceae bacterium]
MRRSLTPYGLLRTVLIVVAVIATLLPVLVTLVTSFKIPRSIIAGTWFSTPTLQNYAALFTGSGNFLRLTGNSLIASLGSTLIIIVVASLAAYSLTRFRWPRAWTVTVIALLLFVQMLPPIVFVGPFYLISRNLGIYDTPLALIMAYMVLNLPLAVFILRNFFADVPRELEDAAAVDGATRLGTFTRIVLPITTPGIAATGILTFIFAWNDFLFALSLTTTPRGMTIPVGVANFAQNYQILYGNLTASAIYAAVPAIVLVVFAQRYITKGLALGAVKG